MQTSRFQLGLIATLAVGLGFSLSSSEAVGYPAGAAVSMGTNPVFSVGGQLSGGDSETLSIGADDQAAVITDVILTATDRYTSCRARSRVILEDSTSTLASFGVGHNSNSSSGLDSVLASLQSGVRIEPGIAVTITSVELHEYSCHGSNMEVEYTVSGYYAQP
jgi:hypothetical protein